MNPFGYAALSSPTLALELLLPPRVPNYSTAAEVVFPM